MQRLSTEEILRCYDALVDEQKKEGQMDTDQMLDLVERYRSNREFITNEETAKMALVVPFIRLLGYDPNMPKEVRLEFCAEFVQGDGKKYADRMDFAIFDASGSKPLMVIETKPLGTDLPSKAQQLARYISQMPDLHFGIITDGCTYLFYGDLENPNLMDKKPFFSFSLEDTKSDWGTIAKFLTKFSRDSFNADTLITDAENSHYRQAMVDRLVSTLKNPADDEDFVKWLTANIYKGRRTDAVKARMNDLAKQVVEPTLMRMISDEFLDKLKERVLSHRDAADISGTPAVQAAATSKPGKDATPKGPECEKEPEKQRRSVETTEQELEFYRNVRDICVKAGIQVEDVVYKDTVNYFNVSFQKPSKWFVRFFSGSRRLSVNTRVPVEEAKQLVPGVEVEEAPSVFGVSRIYLESPAQVWTVEKVILRSLELARTAKEEAQQE